MLRERCYLRRAGKALRKDGTHLPDVLDEEELLWPEGVPALLKKSERSTPGKEEDSP